MNVLVATFLLAVAWVALSGSWTLLNFGFGLLLAVGALFLVRGDIGRSGVTVRPLKLLRLGLIFAYELILSACRVAALVLSPRLDLRPGIFAFPLTVDRDFEIALLANLITLTPGTLSVDVSDDRKLLFVHALDASDLDRTRAELATGFERLILEAFR